MLDQVKQYLRCCGEQMRSQGHGQDAQFFPDQRLQNAVELLSPDQLACLMQDMLKLLVRPRNAKINSLNKFVNRMITKILSQSEEGNHPDGRRDPSPTSSSTLPSPSHPQPTASYKTPSEYPSTPRALQVCHQHGSYLAAATNHSVGPAATTATARALDLSGDSGASSSDNGERTNPTTKMMWTSPCNPAAPPFHQPDPTLVWDMKKKSPTSPAAQDYYSLPLFPGGLSWLKLDNLIPNLNPHQFDTDPDNDPGLGFNPEDIVAWIYRE